MGVFNDFGIPVMYYFSGDGRESGYGVNFPGNIVFELPALLFADFRKIRKVLGFIMSEGAAELLGNPYGAVSYEKLREPCRAFVDKSAFIKELDDASAPRYSILLRPRLFGKSAFVQMLKCFYDLSYKDRYEELFSGKDIYKENLASRNTYHVIDFDFSGVSGDDSETLIDSFIVAIKRGITYFRS